MLRLPFETRALYNLKGHSRCSDRRWLAVSVHVSTSPSGSLSTRAERSIVGGCRARTVSPSARLVAGARLRRAKSSDYSALRERERERESIAIARVRISVCVRRGTCTCIYIYICESAWPGGRTQKRKRGVCGWGDVAVARAPIGASNIY